MFVYFLNFVFEESKYLGFSDSEMKIDYKWLERMGWMEAISIFLGLFFKTLVKVIYLAFLYLKRFLAWM